MSSPTDVIKQLNSARDICLHDPVIYPQVVPGVLPVIGSAAHLELRRWGADFLAETFASPVVTAERKQEMCLATLDTLRGYLNRKEEMGEDEDSSIVKSAVQCAASIYPLVFRHVISNAADKETWSKMAGIKSSILRRMDTASAGVRICCIKFVSRVVQVQTPGMISDPRRPEQNEISLALVPRDHAVMQPSNLEAEASGLLDRLLGVLQDNATDALIVTATLNACGNLVQRRPSVGSKIVSTILNFDPFRLAQTLPIAGKDKVAIRSMARTAMSFLVNTLKRQPSHSLGGRMQHYIERLRHSLTEVFSDTNQLKRPAPDEPTDGLDDAKRQRVNESLAENDGVVQQPQYSQSVPSMPLLTHGPVSFAQLYTLHDDERATSFDVTAFPPVPAAQLAQAILAQVDTQRLNDAINAVRARVLDLGRRQPPPTAVDAARSAIGVQDDDDDYDPDVMFGGDSEAVANELAGQSADEIAQDMIIGTFSLPTPPPLTGSEREEYSRTAMLRIFGTLSEMDRELWAKGGKRHSQDDQRRGFSKLASIGTVDRDSWITLLTRLATRAPFELLDSVDGAVKAEEDQHSVTKKGAGFELAKGIREALLNYVMEDWRRRIDVAIAWLNEEWYSDRLHQQQKEQDLDDLDLDNAAALPNYYAYALRLFDALVPYIDVKDNRTLIRLLSEIPAVNKDILDRIRKIADDPERIRTACQALLYLIMLRPPVRQLAIDCVEEMWRTNEDARVEAGNLLKKWRPGRVEQLAAEAGIKSEG